MVEKDGEWGTGREGPPPLVLMRDIVKVFPHVTALKGVDFEVRTGEIHGLVGKNGAGKSTLVSILTGTLQADQGEIVLGGEIVVGGEIVPHWSSARAIKAGIVLVPQNLKLFHALSVGENLFAGRPPRDGLGFVKWSRLYAEAQERLQQLGLDLDVRAPVEGLTVMQLQMLAIAKALFAEAKLVVLDEPTAPLDKIEIRRLFDFVHRLHGQGVTFVYISHYLEEIFDICDRVTVLTDGLKVGTYAVRELNQGQLIRHIGGAELRAFKREAATDRERRERPVLQLEGLTRPGAYEDVHLVVHEGEILGLTGLEGSGKDKLAPALFGLEPLGAGKVLLDGRPILPRNPSEALKLGIAYLPRDRRRYGIVGIRSLRENVTLPILRALIGRMGFLSLTREESLIKAHIDALGIVTPGLDEPVEFLSGGNQQKVVFAKLASTEPRVLVLHEPTQGVDIKSKVEIFEIIDQLSRRGVGVLFVSDEIQEMLNICDAILVMNRGRITHMFRTGDPGATTHSILEAIEGADNAA